MTQAEIDALRASALRGVLEVRHADGRQVKYASPAEMMRLADLAEQKLAGAASFQRTTSTSFARD